MNRPDWDTYYMVRAFWACRRSPDLHTQHGAVIVGKHHEPISEGYNGYPRGCNDAIMPKTRPEKYLVTLHAEDNAVLNSLGNLEGATVYVTGEPCSQCWCRIIQKGIRRVVIGPKGSHMVDEATLAANRLLLAGRDIEIIKWTAAPKLVARHVLEMLKDMGLLDETIWTLREMAPAGFGHVSQGER